MESSFLLGTSIFAESLVDSNTARTRPTLRSSYVVKALQIPRELFFLSFFYERGVSYWEGTGAFFPSLPPAPPPAAAVAGILFFLPRGALGRLN